MDFFTRLYSSCPDIFYQMCQDFPLESLRVIGLVNRLFYTKIQRGESRNIWVTLWKRDLSLRVKDGSIGLQRYDYLRHMKFLTAFYCDQSYVRQCCRKGFEVALTQFLLRFRRKLIWEDGFRSAARKGHLEILVLYFQAGFPLNYSDNYAIEISIACGHYETIRYLIDRGVLVTRSMLSDCLVYNHVDCMELLLSKYRDVLSDINSQLDACVRIGAIEMAKVLIKYGANLHFNDGYLLLSAIRYCRRRFQDDEEYLSNHQYPCPYTHLLSTGPFMADVTSQHLDFLNYLLKLEWSQKALSLHHHEGLRYAARHDCTWVVRRLLQLGADPTAYSNEALSYAVKNRNTEMKELLMSYGIPESETSFGHRKVCPCSRIQF